MHLAPYVTLLKNRCPFALMYVVVDLGGGQIPFFNFDSNLLVLEVHMYNSLYIFLTSNDRRSNFIHVWHHFLSAPNDYRCGTE